MRRRISVTLAAIASFASRYVYIFCTYMSKNNILLRGFAGAQGNNIQRRGVSLRQLRNLFYTVIRVHFLMPNAEQYKSSSGDEIPERDVAYHLI